MAATVTLPPTCGGGPGAPPSSMNANAATLDNLILSYRLSAGVLTNPAPTTINIGVAQYHAQDMSATGTVGLVAQDGEDPFRRLVCSGATPFATAGVIAVGYSTDPHAVFEAMRDNFASNQVLLTALATKIGVGYSNGYWMVILSI